MGHIGTYYLMWKRCIVNNDDLFLGFQDEVAHTLTENRVLQTTKHPFLTVS